MLLHWSAPPPPKNVWWLSRSPTTSSFSKQTWVVPPLNPSKVLSDSPFWVLSNGWPPFCSPKNQVIPLKSSPRPHLQVINNERSLKTAVDLLTANFARALVDFSKENGNDVCVRATKIKKRGRETDQVFTLWFYLEFLNNNSDHGQATLETDSRIIPFVNKWVIDYFNTSSNYIFKLIHLNLNWAKTSRSLALGLTSHKDKDLERYTCV